MGMGGGSSAFEGVFLVIQALGGVLWIAGFVVLASSDDLGRWRRPALWLQGVICVAAPLIWNIGFPSQDGIEGAGRFLLGAPTSVGNGILGSIWALIACRKSGLGLQAAWPFGLAVAAGAIGWAAFLFS